MTSLYKLERRSRLLCVSLCAAAVFLFTTLASATGEYKLVNDRLDVQLIELVSLSDRELTHVVRVGESEHWPNIALARCIAIFKPGAVARVMEPGILYLNDGQRIPGRALSGARPSKDVLVWNNSTFGRIEAPLSRISAVVFLRDKIETVVGNANADVLLLRNGDRVEGFITRLGDPIVIEIDRDGERHELQIPLDRVAKVNLVAPKQDPTGKRVWLRDGTVIDVTRIALADDGYVRLSGSLLPIDTAPIQVKLDRIEAVLFTPRAMIPLASLSPSRLDGPADRYHLPTPTQLDRSAALGLSPIEISGPIVVYYALPAGAKRFAAEALLPSSAEDWGDFELIIRNDDVEIFHAHLNRNHPIETINVSLSGAELTIELTAGAYGPIQDTLHLREAMVLIESE